MNRLIIILFINFIFSNGILDAQKEAITSIAYKNGYSQEQLNQLINEYGVSTIGQLTQLQAASIINKLQNQTVINVNSNDSNIVENRDNEFIEQPILADILWNLRDSSRGFREFVGN